MLTRRDASKVLLAGAALPLLPASADAATVEQLTALLVRRLNRHIVSDCAGKITVPLFQPSRPAEGGSQLYCVIQLDWPPGFRRRPFLGKGRTLEAAFNEVENKALVSFAETWPGCVV